MEPKHARTFMRTMREATILNTHSSAASRRGLFMGLLGGLLAATPLGFVASEATARKNKKRKRKKKRKDTPEPTPEPTPTPTPEPGPEIRVDATCPGPGEVESSFGGTGGDFRFAQTFTALTSGSLVRADLQIVKTAETFGEYILHLGSVDAFGVPTNEVLALATAASSGLPEGRSTVPFIFTKPFSVEAGTRYALILTQPGSQFLRWQGHGGDICPGRAFFSLDQTAPFSGPENRLELEFSTFVRS